MKTVIGPETRIAGALSGKDDLEVYGTVDGAVHGDAAVTIAVGARIGGEVRGRDVTVGGELTHAVFASGLVRLLATARLTGDIEAPRIAIDEGAVFEGQVRMRGSAGSRQPSAASRQPSPTAPEVASPAQPAVAAEPPGRPPQRTATAPAPAPSRTPPTSGAPTRPSATAAPATRAIPELAAPGRKPLIRKSS